MAKKKTKKEPIKEKEVEPEEIEIEEIDKDELADLEEEDNETDEEELEEALESGEIVEDFEEDKLVNLRERLEKHFNGLEKYFDRSYKQTKIINNGIQKLNDDAEELSTELIMVLTGISDWIHKNCSLELYNNFLDFLNDTLSKCNQINYNIKA